MSENVSWSSLSSYRRECFEKFGAILDLQIIKSPNSFINKYASPDATILDIGSGVDMPFKNTVGNRQYYSLEPDPRAKPDFRDISDIPDDLRFDFAWSNQVLEHLTISEAKALISDLYTVLKPNGVYVSTIPNMAHPVRYWGDATHVTSWSIGDYYGLFRLQGFEVIDYVRYGKVGLPDNLMQRFIVKTIAKAYRMDWMDSLAIVVKKL